MSVYTVTRKGITPVAGDDIITITAPASGMVRILRIKGEGEATASTVMRTIAQRSTGGTTPTAQTPEKKNTRSPAAASTVANAWSTQPSLSALAMHVWAWNAFGGAFTWVATPDSEIVLVNGEIFSFRADSGVGVSSYELEFEEL